MHNYSIYLSSFLSKFFGALDGFIIILDYCTENRKATPNCEYFFKLNRILNNKHWSMTVVYYVITSIRWVGCVDTNGNTPVKKKISLRCVYAGSNKLLTCRHTNFNIRVLRLIKLLGNVNLLISKATYHGGLWIYEARPACLCQWKGTQAIKQYLEM